MMLCPALWGCGADAVCVHVWTLCVQTAVSDAAIMEGQAVLRSPIPIVVPDGVEAPPGCLKPHSGAHCCGMPVLTASWVSSCRAGWLWWFTGVLCGFLCGCRHQTNSAQVGDGVPCLP